MTMISGLDDSLLEFCLPLSARTNKSIREGSMVRDLHKKTNFKLKYFGHLKRSEGLEKIDGKRERGRPRGQWERDIRP